jgi:hypothetical protein
MAKWIEWVPEQAHGVLQQLMREAGKHSGIIWLVEPPPYVRAAITPVDKNGVEHYIAEGGLPVGWIDDKGNIHTFHLNPPFDPPNFNVITEEGMNINYEEFYLSKQWITGLYEGLQMQNLDTMKKAYDSIEKNQHDS